MMNHTPISVQCFENVTSNNHQSEAISVTSRKSVTFKEEILVHLIPSTDLRKTVSFNEKVLIQLIPSRKETKIFYIDCNVKNSNNTYNVPEFDEVIPIVKKNVQFYDKVQVYFVGSKNQ